MLSLINAPSAGGVGAGQTANFRLPINGTFHELYLNIGGLNSGLADVTEIRVFANSKIIHRFSGPERDRLNKFDGRPSFGTGNSGILIIPFTRYNLKRADAEMVTAVATGADPNKADARNVITEFRVEVDFASGSYTPTISMKTQKSLGRADGAGSIIHTRQFVETISAAGEHDISTLAKGGINTAQINRIFLVPNAGEVDAVKIEVDQFVTFDRDVADNNLMQTQGVRVPETTGNQKMFVIDFSEQGYGFELLNTVGIQDLRLKVEASAAMQLKLIVEYVGGIGG